MRYKVARYGVWRYIILDTTTGWAYYDNGKLYTTNKRQEAEYKCCLLNEKGN